MSDREAILRAVLDDPADDLPRLAFADWCEENGFQHRAEFVRMMVRCTYGDLCGHTMESFESRLHLLRRVLWPDRPDGFEGMPMWGDDFNGLAGSWKWHRGFVHLVRCPTDCWLRNGPAICSAHPIERVELTDRAPAMFLDGGGGMGWVQGLPGDGADAPQYLIPGDIYRLLDAVPCRTAAKRTRKVWHDRPAALDALSGACVRWAKLQPRGDHE